MHFIPPLPWWAIVIVAAAVAAVAVFAYRTPLAPLSVRQRALLVGLRAAALGAVLFFLCRPIVLLPPAGARDVAVPVLVDVSRSMRVNDAGGVSRIARAATLLQRELLPALSARFTPEIYSVGESLAASSADHLSADARRSDLIGALTSIRERYRTRRMSGIVLLSDGGDTGEDTTDAAHDLSGVPIYAIGIGSTAAPRDREVLGVTAGEAHLDQASVDLHVSAVSHGFGRAPFELRLLANGKQIDTRRIVPAADGSPTDEQFTVSPDRVNATVYTAAIDPGDESIPENNTRSVLVSPAGPKRKILLIEGAPGFEHSFLTRALAHDPGLEVDTIVRKGKNDTGVDTFLVQAGSGRAASLTSGFPQRREALYDYDAILVANVEGDFFTRAQLQMVADFVSERGGGLLVLGGQSFGQRGLIGTPLEEVVPVELNDRRAGVGRTSFGADLSGPHNGVLLTPAGETHPIMRLGNSTDDTRRRWSTMPQLAAASPLGGPRAGATVLAVTVAPGGAVYPVVAIQRYGRGRSMIFGGEASWRWKMMMPATDRSYEIFWRQTARWLAGPAPAPVAVTVPEASEQGDSGEISIDVSDASYTPAADAAVDATLTVPGGEAVPLKLRRDSAVPGRFVAAIEPDRSGLFRVDVQARRGTMPLGSAVRWFYVGGGDREFADPRLNEGFLRRVARASGGSYLEAREAARLISLLQAAVPQNAEPERQDLWDRPWAFALVIVLISGEWILRRRWGLR
jgi:uncharacterized membrane protein